MEISCLGQSCQSLSLKQMPFQDKPTALAGNWLGLKELAVTWLDGTGGSSVAFYAMGVFCCLLIWKISLWTRLFA